MYVGIEKEWGGFCGTCPFFDIPARRGRGMIMGALALLCSVGSRTSKGLRGDKRRGFICGKRFIVNIDQRHCPK
jgi:hypothetical protein